MRADMLYCALYVLTTISFLGCFSRSMCRDAHPATTGVFYQSHTVRGGLPLRERRTTGDESAARRPQDGIFERIARGDSGNVTGAKEWNFPIGVSSVTGISPVFYPSSTTVASLTDVPRESRE